MQMTDLQSRIFSRLAELAAVSPDRIGAETTIDELGLDSADAVILAMEAEEMMGRDVDVGIFLRFPTVGEAVEELYRLNEGSP